MGEFTERLRAWRSATGRKFKSSLWVFGLWITWHIAQELLKERLVSGTNKFIDYHSPAVLQSLKPTFLYFAGNPVATLAALCTVTITALVVHAYFDTRPIARSVITVAKVPVVEEHKLTEIKPSVLRDRILLPPEITPKFLGDIHRKNISIQAKKLAENYIGKWIRVNGQVADCSAPR
jgi:hypothetical protein